MRILFAVLVLFNWFACTLDCELEKNLCQDDCGQEAVCQAIDDGGYVAPEKIEIELSGPAVLDFQDFAGVQLESIHQRVLFGSPVIQAPPKLLNNWQFAFRTALLARAPSFLA